MTYLMTDVMRRQGLQRPDAVACQFGDRRQTFGQLDRAASRIANGLIELGVGRGGGVAILSKNADHFVEILGGTMKAGAVLLPVNWRLAPPEAAYILRHGEVEVLFAEAEFEALAREAAAGEGGPRRIIVIGGEADEYAAWRDAQSDLDPMLPGDPDDVFVQMYTSGTTGLPKGVQLTHANYAASFKAMNALPWAVADETDTIFAPAPFFHVNGLNGVLRALLGGSRILTLDQFRPAEVVDLFERERVTRGTLAPAMVQMCLDVPGVEDRDFSALKLIIYGGSPISEAVLRKARAVFGCNLAQGYGMTELTGPVAMLAPEDHRDDSKLKSCGKPLPGIGVRVVRADGSDCAIGEVGEVVAQGLNMTPGYARDEGATAKTIKGGWLHTGDAGYFDADGFLYIHDRVKDMIVSGGENVYPAEVENALASDPDIADVAVIGVPDAKWGEAVKAIVVPRPGAAADGEAIIRRVRAHIAGYKAPKSVDFVDAIPRNAAGKILRRDLRAPYWEGRERAVN